MKKYLLSVCIVLTAFAVNAEYKRLVFRTIEGNEQSVGLSRLHISFTNGKMVAVSEGESVEISLTSLKSMEFSDNHTGIKDILADKEFAGKVSVYDTDGRLHGRYESATSACAKLPSGVYIIRAENGATSKILINR